jgi:hypothetical protein
MPALESDLRRQLENVIIQARDVAEGAARSALQKRAVDAAEPFSHFGPKEKELRTRLRARGRQAGDIRNADKMDAGCKAGTTLEDWLRNQFFEQHCGRFQARPFIWHIFGTDVKTAFRLL